MAPSRVGHWIVRGIGWPLCGWAGVTGHWWLLIVWTAYCLGGITEALFQGADETWEINRVNR